MVVYNKTKLNKEDMLQSLIKTTRKSQKSRFLFSFIVLICAVALLSYGFSQKNVYYQGLGYVFAVFAVAYFSLTIFTFIRIPKKVRQKNIAVEDNGITYDYTFKEQSFQVNATINGKTTKLPYKYDAVKKIYEYEERYELYLPENQVFLVSKDGFDSSKMHEFFLKNIEKNKKKIKNKLPKNQ